MLKKIAVALSLVIVVSHAHAADGLLGLGKRVLFLGDSITHAGHYISRIEAQLRTSHTDAVPVLIHLGLPSESYRD